MIKEVDYYLEGEKLEHHMWEQPTSKLFFVIATLRTLVQYRPDCEWDGRRQKYVRAAMKELDRRIPPSVIP